VKASERRFLHIVREAAMLPMRLRLGLIEHLKTTTTFQNETGLRFGLEAVSEYKRAKKSRLQQEPLVKWLASFGPDDVFYDIGANIGGLSLMAARLHEGRVPVVAFEPAFDSFAALVRNIQANDFSSVITPLHVALLDETGVRPFYRSRLGAGSALHAVGEALDYTHLPFTPAAVEHVLAFKLDDLMRTCALPQPTRIKLDVDGFEDKVLAGAVNALSGSPCDLYMELVEVGPDDAHARKVTAFLQDLGYTLEDVVEHRKPGTYPRVMDALFVRR
jgi:FkbM family methyltransferase